MGDSQSQQDYDKITFYTYGVEPSWVIAVLAAFLFACATLVHLIQIFLKRTWFLFPLIIGSFVEVLGYGYRAHGLHEEYPSLPTYMASSTSIIIAPALIAATLYQLLSHIVLANNFYVRGSILKLGLTLVFGASDVLAFSLQAAGAAKLSNPYAKNLVSVLQTGRNMIIAGNVINLLALLAFLTLAACFHVGLPDRPAGFKRLYVTVTLLLIRTSYRIVNYSRDIIDDGSSSEIADKIGGGGGGGGGLRHSPLTHECWLYGFDAIIIFVIIVFLSVLYPSRVSLNEPERDCGDAKTTCSWANVGLWFDD